MRWENIDVTCEQQLLKSHMKKYYSYTLQKIWPDLHCFRKKPQMSKF